MNAYRNTTKIVRGRNIRMSGFLEKKGKMKFVSHWKKYWFILEESLLLYYRSEIEYTNLSPCRGSLNMGLVTTVRPGSSSGPFIIHIITRTQVIQLRAKNRDIQEKWLQALLHSMSLPLVSFKALKSPIKTILTGCGSSLNNIASKDYLRPQDFESDWTLPLKREGLSLSNNGLQKSEVVYGGSLDTAIWSKKLRPIKTPSPSISKGKFLEKILGFVTESDSLVAVEMRSKNSQLGFGEKKDTKYMGNLYNVDSRKNNVTCRVHDGNYRLYNSIKKIKKLNRTFSDSELNNVDIQDSYLSLENVITERKEGSTFVRMRNVLSRISKDKRVSEKGNRSPKKRRQSFLQKILRKKECETSNWESNINDPLYDTIENMQEQTRSSVLPDFRNKDNSSLEKENTQYSLVGVESFYAEVHKPIVGSKMILSAKAMSELKTKLKSRENLEMENRPGKTGPSLPPRKVSRPISPWHDVPTNNAPVASGAKSFFLHQAVVKFSDTVPPIEIPKEESNCSNTENDFQLVLEPRSESSDSFVQDKKSDDLSVLLQQLTKITAAPLAEPDLTDDNYNSSSESEKFWSKSQLSEPDYDVPRSHRPLSIVISEGKEIISSTEFMGKADNYSDTGSSSKSMEPDSLEMAGKNLCQSQS